MSIELILHSKLVMKILNKIKMHKLLCSQENSDSDDKNLSTLGNLQQRNESHFDIDEFTEDYDKSK